MLLQAISMSFVYNSQRVFHWLERQNVTLDVFQMLFEFMPNFKKDFELRRIIFGLTAIINTPESQIP